MGNLFLRAEEVQQILGVSKSYAYKVIKEMNSELQRQGYGDMRVHYLDVGQGDCAFIELSNGQTMLIDARNPQSRADIVNYIKSLQYSI